MFNRRLSTDNKRSISNPERRISKIEVSKENNKLSTSRNSHPPYVSEDLITAIESMDEKDSIIILDNVKESVDKDFVLCLKDIPNMKGRNYNNTTIYNVPDKVPLDFNGCMEFIRNSTGDSGTLSVYMASMILYYDDKGTRVLKSRMFPQDAFVYTKYFK